MTSELPIKFDKDALVPAVIQDVDTAAVLMVGFMNAEALAMTRQTGRVHYWSRSRGALWKKGETSGHEQIVDSIAVNCEQNSLLIQVRQVNAVCHDGYPTCFYRRLEDDGSLTVTVDRWFDPASVYKVGGQATGGLEALSKTWYAAFEHLRNQDLTEVSSTSKRLRSSNPQSQSRIAEELRELAGVLDGTHRHDDLARDVVLEGSQVLYWCVVTAVQAGLPWVRLRPDRALTTHAPSISIASAAKMLRAEAETWTGQPSVLPLDARLHAVIALVAQAAISTGVDPATLIERDLSELQAKPYLRDVFQHPPRT